MKYLFRIFFWMLLLQAVQDTVVAQLPSSKELYPYRRSRYTTTPTFVGGSLLATLYAGDLDRIDKWGAANGHYWGVGGSLFLQKRIPGVGNRLSARLSVGYIPIGGDDHFAKDIFLKKRNLHFRNQLWEVTAMGVVDLRNPNDFPIRHAYREVTRLLPYVMVGVGAVYSNPQALDPSGERWVNLRPLRTEGVSYSKVNLVIPMGLGVRYHVDDVWSVGVEGVLRFTNTDRLDDVSGDYPDRSLLSEQAMPFTFRGNEPRAVWQGAPRSSELFWGTNRQGVLEYDTRVRGERRGYSGVNDYYMSVNFSVTYQLFVKRYTRPKHR